ncbi:MAG: hypothetical protein HQL93_14175, partial [Magnetococcales bacterium]|nr:hypothetical protein [Magnetococcales bacterium]
PVVPRPDPLGVDHQPWLNPPFNILPKATRGFPLTFRMCLHPSVKDRWTGGQYRPVNLVGLYLDSQGNVMPGIEVAEY